MITLKRLLKLTFIVGVLLPVIYLGNYYRLAVSPPKYEFSIEEIEHDTEHLYTTATFSPDLSKIDPPKQMFRITSEIPYMGTHYIDFFRFIDGFDPYKPDGILTWQGKIVAYQYYSWKPVGGYHWHYHKNMCGTQDLVIRYGFSFWDCVKIGGIPQIWGMDQYMLHLWLVDNPAGINDLWNPKLEPDDSHSQEGKEWIEH